MKYCILIIVLIVTNACIKGKDIDCRTYYMVSDIPQSIYNIKNVHFVMDSISLDSTIESSFMGNFWVGHDTLFFSDIFYNYVYKFDGKGAVVNRYLGRGKGPGEILDFMYSFPLNTGYCFISAANSSVNIYDKGWHKTNQFCIHWDVRRRYKEILNHPNPKEIEPYELDLGIPDKVKQWDQNHIAIALSASHPKFNGYFNSSLYYNQSRILALVNLETGKVDELIGRRSPLYLERKNIPNFDHFNFEITEKELLVSFWPDSSIYIIDKSSKIATGKFGKAGKSMQTNYTRTSNFDDAEMNLRNDWNDFGYYSYLIFDPKSKLLFRGYTKGKESRNDGLQIYKDYQLISDIEVPKGFKIIGTVGDKMLAYCDKEDKRTSFYVYILKYEI